MWLRYHMAKLMVRGSKMSELLEFVQNYSTATDTHYHYADFTKNVENIYKKSSTYSIKVDFEWFNKKRWI